MNRSSENDWLDRLGRSFDPVRPPMQPANGVRRIKLGPHDMMDAVTPGDGLFVLAHFGIPHVDLLHWSLVIDGLVRHPLRLGLDALKARPKKIIETVHQCCGNPLEPRVPTRRVANVRWGGVDLAALLDEVGVEGDARFLWSYGLDGGEFAGTTSDWFVKDMPVERLAAGDVLLAYEINGTPLTAEHGFPLRLVVPGYYATNSVKWLWRLHLGAGRADSPFTSRFYNDALDAKAIAAGQSSSRPVWAIAPESIIVAPAPDTSVAAGEPMQIRGWAWSFNGIAAVEISVDGGRNYEQATLEPRRGWAWQPFSLAWRPTDRGEAVICARAMEACGLAQPQAGARNAIHTVRISVR